MSTAAVHHSGAGHARSRESSARTPVMSARSRRPATRELAKRTTSAGMSRKPSGKASTKPAVALGGNKKDSGVAAEVGETPQPDVESNGTGTGSTEETRPKSSGAESVKSEVMEPNLLQTKADDPDGPVVAFSPAPEILDEEEAPEVATGRGGGDGRPLSAYSEVVDPEEFDSKSFLSGISDLSVRLQDDCYTNLDPSSPTRELEEMVTAVSATLSNFQGYALYAQKQMEGLRDQMKTVKDRMHKKVQQKAYDPSSGEWQLSVFIFKTID